MACRHAARQQPRNKQRDKVVARQRPARNSGSAVGSRVFYVLRSEAISATDLLNL
jgi:hypothetical protein